MKVSERDTIAREASEDVESHTDLDLRPSFLLTGTEPCPFLTHLGAILQRSRENSRISERQSIFT